MSKGKWEHTAARNERRETPSKRYRANEYEEGRSCSRRLAENSLKRKRAERESGDKPGNQLHICQYYEAAEVEGK